MGGTEGALTRRASDLNRSLISVCKLQLPSPSSLLCHSFITHSRLVSVQSITYFFPLLHLLPLLHISDSLLFCSPLPENLAVSFMFQLPCIAEQLLSVMVHLTGLVLRPVFFPCPASTESANRSSQLIGSAAFMLNYGKILLKLV